MRCKTEGIVFKTLRFGEADLIVTYLTQDYGIISAFAKSPRKTKSRFGSSLEPFTHSLIAFQGKEQSMPTLIGSDIIQSNQRIREDFATFLNVSNLAEMMLNFIPVGHGGKKHFAFFKNQLDVIVDSVKEGGNDNIHLVSKIQLLAFLGYAPRITGRCGRCDQETYAFFPLHGALLCLACAPKDEAVIRISKGAVSFYKHLTTWERSFLKRIMPSKQIASELSTLLEAHIKHITQKKLKTSEFMAKV
jgi:DNA repair protein RecO (recombination protein O)